MEKYAPDCYDSYCFKCMHVLHTCTCLYVFPREAHMWDVCVSLHMQAEAKIDARSLPQSLFTLFEDRTFHWMQNSGLFFGRGDVDPKSGPHGCMTSVLSTEPFPQSTLTLLSIKQYQLALLQTAEERVSFSILPGPPNKT